MVMVLVDASSGSGSTPLSEFRCTECGHKIGSKTMMWNGTDEYGRGLGFRHERCDLREELAR